MIELTDIKTEDEAAAWLRFAIDEKKALNVVQFMCKSNLLLGVADDLVKRIMEQMK